MSDNRVNKERFRSSVSSVYGNEIFSFSSDLQQNRSQSQVVHLYITGESVMKPDHDGQVFVIYQDLHICGACKKEFVDVVDFLHHKANHSLGIDLFKCDLCKSILSSQELLQEHYDVCHQLAMNLTCISKVDGGSETLPSKENGVGNGNHVDQTQPEALFQSTSSSCHGFLPEGKAKTNNCKRKSKLQVKPMLATESAMIEEVQQPELFEKVFPEPGEARDFDGFLTSGNGESNGNDKDFVHIAASGEEESGTEESCNGHKVEDDQAEQFDFDFLYVTEHSKPSRFSHPRSWLKCLHCEYRTRKHSLLTSHMANFHKDLQEMHQINKYQVGENLLQKQKVMRMSTYEATLSSSNRNLRSKHPRRLEKQDIPGIYPCSTCGKIFRRFRYLRKHQETHQTEKMFVCDDCGKSYKSRTYLRVHRRVHLQKKEFSCNQCNFVSNINAAIHAHRQIHNSGSVLCDICGYAYTDRSTLGKHKRVHDLSRPFACNFPGCKWRFKTEVMCRAHIRAHTTQGKFRCADCGYVFRHKHHLQRHELHMHGVKTSAFQASVLPFHPIEPKDYLSEDDSNNFLPITDLDMPQSLASDLPSDLDHANLMVVHGSSELPISYDSSLCPMSMINEDYSLLDVEILNSKDEDGKHILISELKVFN